MNRLRAVGYARVSTEEQVKGYGIAYTVKAIEKHSARKGWDHLKTFRDEGISGTLPWEEREDAKRLMLLAQSQPRPFDVVIVYETRAIGRKDRTFYRWYWSLQDLGVCVAVVDADIDTTTEEGEAALRDAANESFKELVRIRKRTQNGLQEKAEAGGHVGGVPPFGYVIKDQGKRGQSRLAIAPEAAKTLRRAWELVVREKKGCGEAARILNTENLPGYAGRPWDHGAVRHALKRDVIQTGARHFREVGGKTTHDSVTIPLDRIFSEFEVTQLNAALERTSRPTHRSMREHPLSGVIIGYCGAHYVGSTRGDGRPYYVCTGKKCDCSQVDATAVERRVWQAVTDVILDPERLRRASERWTALTSSSPEDHSARVAELDQQIEEVAASVEAMAPVAALQAARKGLRGPQAQEAVERALKPLTDRQEELYRLRKEAVSWQSDAATAAQRLTEIEELAVLAGRHVLNLSDTEKETILDFLKLRVQILGSVPRKTRRDDGISAWFRDRGRVVPSLTSEAWELVRHFFEKPHPGRKAADPQRVLNALLYKARTGCAWRAIPDDAGQVAMATWQRWTKSGRWDELMDALSGVPGATPPQDGVTLPPLTVYGEIHPDLWIDGDQTDGRDDLLRSSQSATICFRLDLAA